MTRRVVVIGGGVAGSAAAVALRKAGIAVTVYEARPDGGDNTGAALRLPRNGLAALDTIDAYQPVADASVPLPRTDLGTGSGRHLGTVMLDTDTTGHDPRVLSRAKLAQVLRDEAVRCGADVEVGKRLAQAKQTPAGALATFQDGTAAEADILIGADGINSAVRQAIAPSAPEPTYCGTHIVYGYTPPIPDAQPSPDAFKIFWGRKATFGYTSATGDFYWYGSIPAPEPHTAEPADPEHWRRSLLRLFRRDHTPATSIIRAATTIVPTSTRELTDLPSWHNDTMVLIGDAAHAAVPATEQGAALAIEDAVVLAQCLRDTDNAPRALAAFETARRERVVRAAASRRGRTAHQRGVPRWIEQRKRERQVAQALASGTMTPPSWLHDFRIDWDQRLV